MCQRQMKYPDGCSFSPFTGPWIRFVKCVNFTPKLVSDCPVDKTLNFSVSRILFQFEFGEFTDMKRAVYFLYALKSPKLNSHKILGVRKIPIF